MFGNDVTRDGFGRTEGLPTPVLIEVGGHEHMLTSVSIHENHTSADLAVWPVNEVLRVVACDRLAIARRLMRVRLGCQMLVIGTIRSDAPSGSLNRSSRHFTVPITSALNV